MVMKAQGLTESVSTSILNPNISNVHGCHDLSALLLESRLDDISEGVDGDAREDALIHDTYSAHYWLDRAEEGEFSPQVALDHEVEFGGFSEDQSFLMESFHGDSSSPSLRERRNLNNGSHGGCGGGGGGARVARSIQTNKHSICPAFYGKEGLSLQEQNRQFPLETLERAGGPSQDNQKADGTATSSSDLGGNRDVAIGDQLVGNVINQGNEMQAVQGCVSAQKGAFSELICSTEELSYSDVKGGTTLGVKRVQPMAMGGISGGAKEEQPLDNSGKQGGGMGAVPDLLATTKCTISDLKCTSRGLSFLDANGGKMGLPNRVDIEVENMANPMGKSWSQVVNNNVQHKGFTLEYVAP
ncbi:hypothetical protein F0562_006036 [Nyssa sinensis]|uniref:Uncharacterized protein n=1 Tax=Nyssa sinensis TaxID=561372 RepID=A0A5J5APJ7_9ASTE|nr:hypothetical protein F0562_006036 [Nyssa sinensis]